MEKKNYQIIKKFRKIKIMILIKISLFRQEDTRSIFLKKTKDFWGIKKKKMKKEKIKNEQNVLKI